MRTRTTVVDVTDNMQGVNSQPLNQVTHSNDEVICPLCCNNRTDNYIDISMFIRFDRRFMQ